MDVFRFVGKLLLWLGLIAAVSWVLFGNTQLRRMERDEEELNQALDKAKLRVGDLIFHTSKSSKGKAMQLATHSPYNHCGILRKDSSGCVVLEVSKSVKTTPLHYWIDLGVKDRFVVKRLHDAAMVLTPAALARMDSVGKSLLHRPYDAHFGWSDEQLYCSELVWKIYERGLGRQLGRLQHLRDFDLSNPAVQAKLRERYGAKLPLNETVISPVSIFNSPELVTVLSH